LSVLLSESSLAQSATTFPQPTKSLTDHRIDRSDSRHRVKASSYGHGFPDKSTTFTAGTHWGGRNVSGNRYLMKEQQRILDLQESTVHGDQRYWTYDLGSVDDLYTWRFFLSNFDTDLPMVKEMKSVGATVVHLEIRFLPDAPNRPPFVRIIKPRFVSFQFGGGGHVTAVSFPV